MTLIILGVTAVLLIIYDIIIALTKGGSFTISWVLYTYAQKYPVVGFALGFVLGHIIWVQNCICGGN